MESTLLKFLGILILLHYLLLLSVSPSTMSGAVSRQVLTLQQDNLRNIVTRQEESLSSTALTQSVLEEIGRKLTKIGGWFLHNFYSTSTNILSSASTYSEWNMWKDREILASLSKSASVYSGTIILGKYATRLSDISAWLRQFGVDQTVTNFGLSVGSFYAGLVFGKLPGFSPVLHPLFDVTGMQYILVVSGFHLSLLARTVVASLQGFVTKTQVAFVLFFLVFVYFTIAGASHSLLRASIMLAASIIGRYLLLRQHRARYFILLMIAIITLMYREIIDSVSFQLSAAATAGIIYLMPLFTRGDNLIAALERAEITTKPLTGTIVQKYIVLTKSSFIVSVCVNLSLIPLLLYYFGEVSLISIGISTIFFWLAPLLVVCAWFIVLFSILISPGAILYPVIVSAKAASNLVISFVEFLLSVFEKTPFLISVENLSLNVVISWWILLIVLVILKSHMSNQRQQYKRLAI